jgi:Fe-S cluster assembly ATPase SufC
MLEINNLHMGIDGREVLYGVNPKINDGEVHAFLGLNDSEEQLIWILSLNLSISMLSETN